MYLLVFFILLIYSTTSLVDFTQYILDYGKQLKQCSDLKGIDLNKAISKMAVRHKHRIRIAMKQLKARDEPEDSLTVLTKAFGEACEMTLFGNRIKADKKEDLIKLIKEDLVFGEVEFLMGIYNISSVFNADKIMGKTPKDMFDEYCENLISFINNDSYIYQDTIKMMANYMGEIDELYDDLMNNYINHLNEINMSKSILYDMGIEEVPLGLKD